ncbi:hypothetical protein GCM10020000_35850 [Streptomyces olivoverticillatus]
MTVRRPDQAGPAQYLALAAVGVVLLLVGGSYVALVGAQWWATGSWEAVGPFAPLFGLATGDWHWTTAATVIVLIELAVVARHRRDGRAGRAAELARRRVEEVEQRRGAAHDHPPRPGGPPGRRRAHRAAAADRHR